MYDIARALFWNVPETRIEQMLKDHVQFNTYVSKCAPPVGWDNQFQIDFFRLVGLIWGNFEGHHRSVGKFLTEEPLKRVSEILDQEFSILLSLGRRELIKRCLHLRQHYLREAVAEFGKKEEL